MKLPDHFKDIDPAEAVQDVIAGMTELGAVYVSHDEDHMIIKITAGSILDNLHFQDKAKATVKNLLDLNLVIQK